MPATTEKIVDAIKRARGASPKRNFVQSIDMSIVLKGIDPKKPEGRITEDIVLPNQFGEPKKVLVFAESELARRARESGADMVLSRRDVEELGQDRKRARKLASKFDFSIAQADLMVLIGKALGPVLGPKGKMPKPVPPTINPGPIIQRLKQTLRLIVKDQPVVHVKIGMENMDDDQLAANARAVLEAIEHRLADRGGSIQTIMFKTTMGKPAKVEV
ncbi:MAG: 50S ribosomal protein L1 [Hadesarchaea archaeon]|nr:MAG: 50S ribosomal protein L1 [Hadesarchaea archaeon]HDI13150.1 50S ribosomal protein L1 [Hadesarchaea archaeon]